MGADPGRAQSEQGGMKNSFPWSEGLHFHSERSGGIFRRSGGVESQRDCTGNLSTRSEAESKKNVATAIASLRETFAYEDGMHLEVSMVKGSGAAE